MKKVSTLDDAVSAHKEIFEKHNNDVNELTGEREKMELTIGHLKAQLNAKEDLLLRTKEEMEDVMREIKDKLLPQLYIETYSAVRLYYIACTCSLARSNSTG